MTDYTKLAAVIRLEADKVETGDNSALDARRQADLLLCLARLLEGKTPYQAFGAPGDWGYGTPIGNALREAYGCR